MPTAYKSPFLRWRNLLIAVLLLFALYVLVPQLSVFSSSWHLLSQARLSWLVLAIIATLLTYFFAALTYCLLAFYRLHYLEVVTVEFAAMLINRLLPAGVGALGANYTYLRHRQHNTTQAATVIAVNNILGLFGHFLIVVFIIVSSSAANQKLILSSERHGLGVLWLVLTIVLMILCIAFVVARHRVLMLLRNIALQLRNYSKRPLRILAALISSMLLTSANIFCFHFCANALGVHLSLIATVIIFTIGLSAGTVTPTPGGLGGFEAGLVAAFLVYGVASSPALAIALLYRLVSYWLMLVFGASAFMICVRRQLFQMTMPLA
jgi:uncharacterized protein (TIRG00374 family)